MSTEFTRSTAFELFIVPIRRSDSTPLRTSDLRRERISVRDERNDDHLAVGLRHQTPDRGVADVGQLRVRPAVLAGTRRRRLADGNEVETLLATVIAKLA